MKKKQKKKTPKTFDTDAPIADSVAFRIGMAAAEWKTGKIDAAEFAKLAGGAIEELRLIEAEFRSLCAGKTQKS